LEPYKFKYYVNETTGFVEGDSNNVFRIQFEFLSSLEGAGIHICNIV